VVKLQKLSLEKAIIIADLLRPINNQHFAMQLVTSLMKAIIANVKKGFSNLKLTD
jgi:hypothetical protein